MNLPFRIDFGARKPLSQQAADGFRTAIKEGFYKDGETLPTLRELAELWRVSVKVPGHAYKRLADEGYVVLHPGRGAVARRSGVRSWNGNVLFVSVGQQGGFFLPQFQSALRMGIEDANMRFYETVVPTHADGEGPDFARFKSYLDQPYDIVILLTNNPRLRRMVRRIAPRSLVVGIGQKGRIEADVQVSTDEAEALFVEDCVRAKVHSLDVMNCGGSPSSVVSQLKSAGIRVRMVRVNPAPGLCLVEGYQRAAHDYWTDERLNRQNLPELIYFSDDNLALGSLIAFAEKGVRVPDDIPVVTLGNRGSALPFGCDLARIEVDPIYCGKETIRQALLNLQTRASRMPIVCQASYHRGKSFPVGA